MLLKTRLLILAIFVISFMTLAPYLVMYSMGYRVDFSNRGIVETGGIYVKAAPLGASISISSVPPKTTNIFLNYVFVQNLSPKSHNVTITKEGYYEYQKNLPVVGNQVTKLENVILFKKDIRFSIAEKEVQWFSLSPDGNKIVISRLPEGNTTRIDLQDIGSNQNTSFSIASRLPISQAIWSSGLDKVILKTGNSYFLMNSPSKLSTTPLPALNGAKQITFGFYPAQNASQEVAEKIFFLKNNSVYVEGYNVPILSNTLAYENDNQNIFWLSNDGFAYVSDKSNISTRKEKLNLKPIEIKKSANYILKIISGRVFLQENDSLFILNQTSKEFILLANDISVNSDDSDNYGWKISPDATQMSYTTKNQMHHIDFGEKSAKESVLQDLQGSAKNISWINNYYIIYQSNNSVIISETDTRGNVNSIVLPNEVFLDTAKFNPRNQKLYTLSKNILSVSEKIVP